MERCREYAEPFEFELPIITANKDRVWVKSKGKPIIEDGKVIGISGIIQEVTNEKAMRENLIAINEELDSKVIKLTEELSFSDKELETFTYTVSHDLRSPLLAIEGFSNALQENYVNILDEDGKRWLKYIVDNSVKMGTLISDILVFSRVRRTFIEPVEVNINQIIENKFDELKHLYKNNIIKLNVEKLPKFTGDKNLFNILWNNLLSNALKFSSTKEEIQIEITGKIEKEIAIYEIKDNGVGFDEKYIHKLFVVFQRLHATDEFEGSGVGLAIVETIIKKHNGWVKITTKVGQGTTLTYGIPII
jgi:light-regulated signal transduction histidine kinase (bacteriophytochrome)